MAKSKSYISNKKKILILIGISTLIANSLIIYLTFLVAFFNGHTTKITINSYNEMYIEFFFIPITLTIGLWSVWFLLKSLTKSIAKS